VAPDMEVAVVKSQLHEMRGNLTVILGAIELGQPEMAKTAVKALITQCDNFGALLDALSRFSGLNPG
jgi:hypothetical protein